MNDRRKLRVYVAVLAIASIVGIAFLALDDGQNAGALTFNIPLPQQELSLILDDENPDVKCRINNIAYAIDSDGKTLTISESGLFGANPKFALTANGKVVAGYVNIPEAGCNSKYLDITILPSDLFLVVKSTDKNQKEITTATRQIKTNQINIPANSGDIDQLGYMSVLARDIEDKIRDGSTEFNTRNTFSVIGTIKIVYTKYPNLVFYFVLPSEGILTSHVASVQPDSTFANTDNDADDDGIININDTCPNSAENYNGYLDNDGCPDVPPTPTSGSDTESSPPPENIIDTTEECASEFGAGYTWNGSLCVPPQTGSDECVGTDCGTGGSLAKQNSRIKINTIINYADGSTQAFLIPDDADPFPFDLNPNSLIDTRNGASGKAINTLEHEVFVNFADTSQLPRWSSSASNLSILISLSTDKVKIELPAKPLAGFAKSSGSGKNPDFGISVGKIIINAGELENAVTKEFDLLEGQSKTVNYKAEVIGAVTMVKDQAPYTGKIEDANVNWSLITAKLKTAGSGGSQGGSSGTEGTGTNGGGTTIPAGAQCSKDEFAITLGGVSTCFPKGSNPQECTEDASCKSPKIGDTGVQVCTDDESVGGFPCSEEYRAKYCQSTTICKVPTKPDPTPKTVTGCKDSFGHPTMCIANTETEKKKGSGGQICSASLQDTICSSGFDESTLVYIAIGGGIMFMILMIAVAKKRQVPPPQRW